MSTTPPPGSRRPTLVDTDGSRRRHADRTSQPNNVLPFVRPRPIADMLKSVSEIEVHPLPTWSDPSPTDTGAFTVTTVMRRVDPAQSGTMTLIGIGPRAVRATSKSGWLETRVVEPSQLPAQLPTIEITEPPGWPANTNTKPALAGPWARFERIGLGPKKAKRSGAAATLVVSAYRLLGFGDPHDHRRRARRLHHDDGVLLPEQLLDHAGGGLAERREGGRARIASSPSSTTSATGSPPSSTTPSARSPRSRSSSPSSPKRSRATSRAQARARPGPRSSRAPRRPRAPQIRDANDAYATRSRRPDGEGVRRRPHRSRRRC